MSESASYFVRLGPGRFRATERTSGAWNDREQHIAPMFGLIVHEIELDAARRGTEAMVLTRLSGDILGTVPIDDFELGLEVVRPGRTIELVEATVVHGGRAVLRARAWRLAGYDTASVAGGAPAELPPVDEGRPWSGTHLWLGGFISDLDIRRIGEEEPGRGRLWMRTDIPLLPDEPIGATAQLLGMIDTANGTAVRESPLDWLFPNLDLTIHLFRQPVGSWVGLDSRVVFGDAGVGLTSATLYDETGSFGRAEQSLTVRPAPGR